MNDLSPCRVCELEFVVTMAACPRCGWPRSEGEGGVREPVAPEPDGPLTGVMSLL